MALHQTPFDRTPPVPKAEDATPVRVPRVASKLERFLDRFDRACDGALMASLLFGFLALVMLVVAVLVLEACGLDVVSRLPGRI